MAHDMTTGGPCGRPDGHNGPHLRPETVERQRTSRLVANMTPERAERRRERMREIDRQRRTDGRREAIDAAQLARGERIASRARHHAGMAALVAERLGPRPKGHTLSLVDPLSLSAYLGYTRGRRGRVGYVLSTDPADYVWESLKDNHARGNPTADLEIVWTLAAREWEAVLVAREAA